MSKSTPVNGNLIGILGGIILSTDSVFIRLMSIDNSWMIVMLRGLFMWGLVVLVYLLWPKSRGARRAVDHSPKCLADAVFLYRFGLLRQCLKSRQHRHRAGDHLLDAFRLGDHFAPVLWHQNR